MICKINQQFQVLALRPAIPFELFVERINPVIWLALIKLLPLLVPRLAWQMRKIPNESLLVENLAITHDVKKLNRYSGRDQPPCFIRCVPFALEPLKRLPTFRRIVVVNLIPDDFENRLAKLRICLGGFHGRLTTER
jgi:hypothetical protein